jgi:hypothetical protein
MSEFTVSAPHDGVSVSITVKVAPDAKYVEASALHLIPQIDLFTSKVRAAVRTAASNGIWPIAADVVNAINECALQARTRDAANQKMVADEAIGSAVVAERERMQAIHTEQLEGRDNVINSLANKIETLEATAAAKAKRASARKTASRKP